MKTTVEYYEDGKYIQIQGRIANDFNCGKWTYCMYPDESGNQECYEANFENGIMVGAIRKIKNK